MSEHNIVRLEEKDFDSLNIFLAQAFDKQDPQYFSQGLAGYYQPTPTSMACNYAIKIQNQIAAVVGLFPMQFQVGKETLSCAGIGGVSVGKAFRGQGLMGKLIKHVVNQIKTQNYDLAWLSGDRQRYRYFGWEQGGTANQYYFTTANLKHAKQATPANATLQTLNPNDTDTVQSCLDLYQAQPFHLKWSAQDFAKRLTHRFAQPYILKDHQNKVKAYAYINKDQSQIQEITSASVQDGIQLIDLLVQKLGNLELIHAQIQNPALSDWLSYHAQSQSLINTRSWMMLNFPKIINACANLRFTSMYGSDQLIYLTDQDKHIAFTDEADGKGVKASWTQPGCINSHTIQMDSPSLTRLLFSFSNQLTIPDPLWNLGLAGISPLPLTITTPDFC